MIFVHTVIITYEVIALSISNELILPHDFQKNNFQYDLYR
jgi:hypothetical protein